LHLLEHIFCGHVKTEFGYLIRLWWYLCQRLP